VQRYDIVSDLGYCIFTLYDGNKFYSITMHCMKRMGGRPADIDWEQGNAPAGSDITTDYTNGKIATGVEEKV
jgi:hypothetical protein